MLANEFPVNQRALALTEPFQVVRVEPVFGLAGQAVFDGVGVDVSAESQQMCVRGDRLGLKRTLEQRSHAVEALVDRLWCRR